MADEKDSGYGYDEKITIRIDRRLAEDLYYDLLLGFGGRAYREGSETGKSGGKSYVAPKYDPQ